MVLLTDTTRHRGFTLLEIMLVIVLIGLTSSLVINQFSTGRNPLANVSNQLEVTLKNTLERANQKQTLYGLAFAQNGWQLMVYSDNERSEKSSWHPTKVSPFTLPEMIAVALEVERKKITLAARLTPDMEPQIWIFPGGETTLFTVSLSYDLCVQRIIASGFMSFQQQEVSCDEK